MATELEQSDQPARTRATTRPAKLEYSPALDGLRAICLTGVLLFHAPFEWMSGGFLGVSTFFTLSGYLIATLLLREWQASKRIDLAAFWDRRLRRLGPPLWLGVLGVVASAPWWVSASARSRLLPDAATTLAYVSNWRFMSPEYAYAQLFSDPSPLQHSWSLSIEAQYYLLFPFALLFCLRRSESSRPLALLLLAIVAASIAAALTDPGDSDATNRVYYGTLSRAAEPLAGALLALWLARAPAARGDRWLSYAAPIAAILMLLAWSLSGVSSAWLYRGGFALHALLSAIVIAALLRPGNPMQRALAVAPLPWIGRLSYGAYIYHWPIFLIVDAERTALAPVPLFALRALLTLLAAWASLRLIEHPVRSRKALGARRAVFATSVAAPLALAAPIWIELPSPRSQPAAPLARPISRRPEVATAILGRKPRIAGFGDSTALVVGFPLGPWLKKAGMDSRPGGAQLGCSLMPDGMRYFQDRWRGRQPKRCRGSLQRWKERAEEIDLDVAYILVGPWDVLTRRFRGDDTPRAIGDPIYDDRLRREIDRVIEMFSAQGVGVIWITSPPASFSPKKWTDDSRFEEASDPKRMQRLNELIREAAERWPDNLRIVDFAQFLAQQGIDLSDETVRPDGIHFTREAIKSIIDAWLGPEIIRSTDELVPLLHRPASADS